MLIQLIRIKGELVLRQNWFKGFIRTNGRLLDLTETIAGYCGFGEGKVLCQKTIQLEAMTEKGPLVYEAIPAGTKIETILRYPHKGTPIETTKKLKEFFEMTAIAPIRGWGANPYYYGGKMKVILLEETGV